MAKLMTFSEDNQFSFVCPIFNATTKLASCMKLREMVWMGQKPDKRVGCQAAMRCSKCPATSIVNQIIWGKFPQGTPDNYGSKEPVVGKLRSDILHRLRRTMLQDRIMDTYPLSDIERQLLLTANDRIDEQLKTAPVGEGRFVTTTYSSESTPATPRRRVREKTELVETARNDNIADAARTGNMAVAISGAQ